MPHHTHIEAAGMAHTFSARAHRSVGIVRCRTPRDMRSRSIMPSPSGESEVTSISRERDGVGERELRSCGVDHHPSGESRSAFFSRERDGVRERELRSGGVDHHLIGESASACTYYTNRYPARPSMPSETYPCTTSRFVQPATSRCVCNVFNSMNPNPVVAFRTRW